MNLFKRKKKVEIDTSNLKMSGKTRLTLDIVREVKEENPKVKNKDLLDMFKRLDANHGIDRGETINALIDSILEQKSDITEEELAAVLEKMAESEKGV